MTEYNDSSEQPQPQEPKPELPGKRLSAAREAKGLTREGVAAQLRLQLRHIIALEEDDYDALPGPTFTTGYLRSYARLLELPEDSIVAPTMTEQQSPPLVQASANSREISSSDGIARLGTYLVIGVMIVSVAMWWIGRQEEVEPPAEPPLVENGESQVEPLASVQPQAEALAPGAVEPGEEISDGLSAPATQGAEDDTASAAQEDVTIEEQVGGVGAGEPEEVPPVGETTPAATVAANSVEPEQPAPPPLTEETPQSKLELRFEADSWAEVRDNAGRQLLYRLIKEGNVLVLRGEAPFHVFLGYAPGVTVYYNGELFEHSVFQRRDVARFRVGSAEHNHPGYR